MSDWGQGAVNNNIGWGQGAANGQSINWGQVHPNSFGHPETNLVGILSIISELAERAYADGASVEALVCISESYSSIINISVILDDVVFMVQRAYADGASVEAIDCINDNLKALV